MIRKSIGIYLKLFIGNKTLKSKYKISAFLNVTAKRIDQLNRRRIERRSDEKRILFNKLFRIRIDDIVFVNNICFKIHLVAGVVHPAKDMIITKFLGTPVIFADTYVGYIVDREFVKSHKASVICNNGSVAVLFEVL